MACTCIIVAVNVTDGINVFVSGRSVMSNGLDDGPSKS